MKNRFSKGFTLIELLIVIAIIGILSTVVMFAIGTSRTKAADTAVFRSLQELRSRSQIVFNNNGFYANGTSLEEDMGSCRTVEGATFFDTDANTQAIMAGLRRNAAADPRCSFTATEYRVSIQLKSGRFACADSRNVIRTTNASGVNYTGLDTGAAPMISVEYQTYCN